jgi:hypothetical protein
MIDIYKEMFPNRGMNHQILKSSLCERGLHCDKEICMAFLDGGWGWNIYAT